jgi:membrane protease YdiL (CAAX protease family)
MADDSAGPDPETWADGSAGPASIPGIAGDGAAAVPAPIQPVASTLGTVAAGLVFAALFLPGGGADATVAGVPLGQIARGAAGFALAVFVLHRRVAVPDRPVGAVAALAGLVVVAADLLTVFGELSLWSQPLGLPVATALAIPVVGMGAALALAVPSERVLTVTWGVGVATVTGMVGFFVSIVGASLLTALGISIAGTEAIAFTYPVLTVSAAVATVAFVATVLDPLGKDRSWVDLSMPTRWDLAVAAVGLLALFVVLQGLTVLIAELGLPTIESSVEKQAAESGTPEFLLLLVPLSFLAIAPSEELLYRGIVQKYLYEYVTERQAVVAASAIFAVIHYGQYADPNPIRMAVSLSTVFILSLGLGYVYARTDNLVVPILVHGAFNAVTFLAMYARVTGGAGLV